MRDIDDVKAFLCSMNVPSQLIQLVDVYSKILPNGQSILSDSWDIHEWDPRPGNSAYWILNFDMYRNEELKLCVKLFILSRRFSRKVFSGTVANYFYALQSLDAALGSRGVEKLSSQDFYAAEQLIKDKSKTGFSLYINTLQVFSRWFSSTINPLVEFFGSKMPRSAYGRNGTDEGREKKLLPDEVVANLFSVARLPDIDDRDKFFLNAFVLDVVIQGRINELATLPLNCLIDPTKAAIKTFTEKNGRLGVRYFPTVLLPAIKAAIEYIKQKTDPGREIISELRKSKALDWLAIIKDDEALRYFTGKFVSHWVDTNKLIDPYAVWSTALFRPVNAISILEKFNGSYTKASAFLEVSYSTFRHLIDRQKSAREGVYLLIKGGRKFAHYEDVDGWEHQVRFNPRAIGYKSMQRVLEIDLHPYLATIGDILDGGLVAQMQGKDYPEPSRQIQFEEKYLKKIKPVLRNRAGETLLEPEDALFVIPRNLFTTYGTKSNQYSFISDKMFNDWLSSQAGDKESIFYKCDIRDPRTGGIARFTWHDVRHWMQSVLKRGGLTDVQAALLAGRKDSGQTKIYDHTSALTRSDELAALRQSIRDGHAVGRTSTTYAAIRLVDSSLADEYLNASTLVLNRMPHGGCTLNLALNPCINNLSCFSQGDDGKACNHLIVDPSDLTQINEVKKIHSDAVMWVKEVERLGGLNSPQFNHFRKIAKSTEDLLRDIESVPIDIITNNEGEGDGE